MPIWLQNEGAWIAMGVSLVFVVAGWVMHRVFVRVLKSPLPPRRPQPADTASQTPAEAPTDNPNAKSKK
ncbi:MAG: hypothetical protein U1D25_15510 [Hydrogenophaga sp.]|uniref:hypothetical protein n=1 Tax=Hydrogenophaga sp. TaxID=1904254 RepID=UPI002751E6E3|nr:hypothetical protein [Hydrogenophaga sp.]MDP2419642.1 hypothetical protein [Hydrogenophaga sp.]MDZ4189496.1 hypothetical protein [Hydrogenophaga sp.]